jgi:SAM-dependent methyltransferase
VATGTGATDSFAPDFVGPRHRLREDLLLKLFLSGRPGKAVLNGGAGQGTFSRTLEQHGFDVTSVDPSPEAVALLRDRVAGPVFCAPLEALPLAPASMDAAVLGEVLEHIEDDRGALAAVAHVLRPGGVLAVSVPANPAYFGPSDRWAGHVRRYRRERLVEAVASAGFTVERCDAWGFPVSSLYHRYVYDPRIGRRGAAPPGRGSGPALTALGLLLRLDRLFVGVERGALGYLLLARK